MAKKELAVDGCTLSIQAGGGTGDISITTLPSIKAKKVPESKGIYSGDMIIAVSNGVNGSCGTSAKATGGGSIVPTSIKNKVENKSVIRTGDKNLVPILMTGTEPASPSGTKACTYNITVEVTDAGQTKITGE